MSARVVQADDAATADDTPKKDEPVEAATKPDATAASTGGGSGGAGSAGAATGAAPSDAAVSKELLVNILQRIISGSQQLLVRRLPLDCSGVRRLSVSVLVGRLHWPKTRSRRAFLPVKSRKSL